MLPIWQLNWIVGASRFARGDMGPFTTHAAKSLAGGGTGA